MITYETLFESPNRLMDCIDFVTSHFGNRDFFELMLTECTKTPDKLPQGYMMIKNNQIIGYSGLIEKEEIVRDYLSPWISPLLIAPAERGNEYGGKLLCHVREEAGKFGLVKLYLTTNHIGYYEKYGFREIGLSNFTWGHPTKIYTVNAIGFPKLTERLIKEYPDTEVILLRGSFARNDGIDVQDVDVSLFHSGDNQKEEHIFENGVFYDIAVEPVSILDNMNALLCDPYLAGSYADAQILFDKTGKMKQFLAEFKDEYPKPEFHKKRVLTLKANLEKQYQDVLSSVQSGSEIDIHCRFATYTWTLCDVILVKHLKSPSWIRGLHKVSKVDKELLNCIIDAEGSKTLTRQQALDLLPLYSEIWQGQFWDFLKSEIKWLIVNISEPIGFHPLNICFMMGIENRDDKVEYFKRWNEIVGDNKILPMESVLEFAQLHSLIMKKLNFADTIK